MSEREKESERVRVRKGGREGEIPDEINLICPIYRKKFEFPSTKLENIL